MSTPTGKPIDRVEISDDAPKSVRDQLAASDEGAHREGPARATDPFEEAFGSQPKRDARIVSVSAAQDGDGDSLQTAFNERIAAYGGDLQRVEAALEATRRAQVNQSARRLPPAPQLPHVQGLRWLDDVHTENLRLQRSLRPACVPPPPDRKGRSAVRFGTLAACAMAVPIAYFALNYYGGPAAITRAPKVSTLETEIAALPPMPAIQPKPTPPLPAPQSKQSPVQPPQPSAANRYRLQTAVPTTPSAREMIAVVTASENQPASPAASSASSPDPSQAEPAPRPAPTIAREDIAMLREQGEQLMAVGDVAAARVLFEHAAEAGDGNAALALGASYDPVVLAQLGVRGIAPDPDKAQLWYQKAREYGAPEAPAWLAKLAGR